MTALGMGGHSTPAGARLCVPLLLCVPCPTSPTSTVTCKLSSTRLSTQRAVWAQLSCPQACVSRMTPQETPVQASPTLSHQ